MTEPVLQIPLYYSICLSLVIIMIIAFFMAIAYRRCIRKAVYDYTAKLPSTPQQLNALINSLNDIIFEFNEDKVCLNVWFNDMTERVVDPKQALGRKLDEIIGEEKAKKFNDALDYVIEHKKPTSLEYLSDHGTGNWLIAKVTPVFDRDGKYTGRISASVSDISEQKKYADALKEKELLLLEAQAIAKIGNWLYDSITRDTYLSASFFSVLEIEAIPENTDKFEYYISLVHPDDKEIVSQFLISVSTTIKQEHEHRLITPSGALKYIRISIGDKVFHDDGSLKRIFGIIQDITDIKVSEKTIKKGRSELIEAQTIAKIGNWNWSIGKQKLAYSDEIANIFELPPQELSELDLNRLLLRYVHPNDKFILQHLIKSAATITNYTCVLRIITPTGTIKYVSIIIGKILKNDDGSARKIIGTLQDVTDRKMVEIDYQRTENKYKLVLETIKLVALSLDSNSNVIFCNQYLANLLGYSQTDILGMNWIDNFIPDEHKVELEAMFTTHTLSQQYINPVICRNGEQRVISWQNTVSYDENGHFKETTSIGEDITDLQKATQELISAKELAERASKFKSDFLSIMSHEIRTPMNAVIGTTNLLISDNPKPEQLEYLNILRFSGENLLAIINDILDYNKIEAGKLELNQLKFNIHHLAQKTRQAFYSRAAEKKLQLDLSIDEQVPEFVIGDQMRLSQILNNLISNAIKFTHTGSVTIQLQTAYLNSENVAILFKIIDTGIGISPESQDIIFDPFIQEPLVNNNNNAGTGLGLAITKRLINLHKSDIAVISETGKGAEFFFTIAFALPEAQSDDQLAENDKNKPTLNLHGMNVLVVDDNKMNLLIASRFLNKWQANVDEALNGQLAVNMVNHKIYDLIIMDLQMPVMNGFEATEIIKKSHPDIPIIALTADAMPETYNKALQSGMCDYLTKPFVPAVFFEKVSAHYKRA